MKLLPLSIFILIAFATASIDLSGQAGKIALEGIQNESNQSTLWNWGSAPAGHIVNDSQLIAGAWVLPIDRSSMETPSRAVLEGARATGVKGQTTEDAPWFTEYWSGFDGMNYMDKKSFKSGSGIFDSTRFNPPTQSLFPRIY